MRRIKVRLPDGTTGSIPEDKLPQALRMGLQILETNPTMDKQFGPIQEHDKSVGTSMGKMMDEIYGRTGTGSVLAEYFKQMQNQKRM